MAEFTCSVCGATFALAEDVLARFPGWKPRFCRLHKGGRASAPDAAVTAPRWPTRPLGDALARPAPLPRDDAAVPPVRAPLPAQPTTTGGSTLHGVPIHRLPPGPRGGGVEGELTPEQVLTTYFRGPQDGVFTDGGARPNPGQGGWGWVYVEAGRILAQGHGGDRQTTNNRMEMSAIIDALRHLPPDAATVLYSDSDLCIKTLTQWARGWEARGWRKKDGEIKNLDLVQQAWALVQERPHVRLQWIKAHDGSRWNEYVDALATEFLRGR